MKRFIFLLNLFLCIIILASCGSQDEKASLTSETLENLNTLATSAETSESKEELEENIYIISALEALDIIKNYLNDGGPDLFEPLHGDNIYYIKNSNVMIEHDNYIDDEVYGKYHVIHQYEIVIDDPETGDGHTATYNWFEVDALTGDINPMFFKDFELNPDY